MWDCPHVNLTTDNRGRLTSAGIFRPKTSYRVEKTPEGWIKVTELVPAPTAEQKPASDPQGKLVEDPRTGLLVWTGDLGEDEGLAVLRNREQDR